MKETFNLYIKREINNTIEYSTVDTSNIYHVGDPIWLAGEKWIVISGTAIPTRR